MNELTRRDFIIACSSSVITSFLQGAGIASGIKATGEIVAKPFSALLDTIEYSEYFERFFLPKNKFYIASATQGVPKGIPTYSNEAYAIRAINTTIGGSNKIVDEAGYEVLPESNDSFIALGGSGTNQITRDLLGHPDAPKFSYNTGSVIHEYKYTIAKIDKEKRIHRTQDGAEKKSFRYALVNKNKELIAVPKMYRDGRIKTDYLLITKLSLFPRGGELISFAGLHGPSIRGVAKLINQLSSNDLKLIDKAISSTGSSFQMILRMDDIIDVPNEELIFTSTPQEVSLLKGSIHGIKQKLI
jgi:hypothetical protein